MGFMKRIKELVAEEKKNMPEYQYNFLYKRVFPGFIFVLGGAIVLPIIILIWGLTIDDYYIIPCLLVLFWLITTIVLTVLFVIKSKQLSQRLLDDKTQEFENKFQWIEYDVAVARLEKRKAIEGNEFIANDKKLAMNDCYMVFYCKTLGGAYYFNINIYDREYGNLFTVFHLDRESCTFFYDKKDAFVNKELFELFVRDKKTFLQLLYKYNDADKMLKHIR